MTLIWGTNYTVVKYAFTQLDPQAFNAVRMTVASVVFLVVIAAVRRSRASGGPHTAGGRTDAIPDIFHSPAQVTPREWLGLAGLGIVGHGLYQYCFIAGLAQTSVANSALVLATTPVLIAVILEITGQERISALHWVGAGLSLAGIYLVVGGGLEAGAASLTGDLLIFAAAACFAIYTLGAEPLMTRHSPVGVTGVSMAIGTAVYVPAVLPHLRAVDWRAVGAGTWLAVVYSALFALCVSYTIWYAAVREIGSARTSVYSNLIPLVAMAAAAVLLGEPVGLRKIAGAAAVLTGVALTRVRARLAAPAAD